jgi:hypothetical protein
MVTEEISAGYAAVSGSLEIRLEVAQPAAEISRQASMIYFKLRDIFFLTNLI